MIYHIKAKIAKQHKDIIQNIDLDKDEKFRKEYCVNNYLIKKI